MIICGDAWRELGKLDPGIVQSRKFIGIELNPEYVKLAEKRLREVEMVMF